MDGNQDFKLLNLDLSSVVPGKQLINTDEAPAAVGAYSQAVKAGETLYVSGQVGLIPGVIIHCAFRTVHRGMSHHGECYNG